MWYKGAHVPHSKAAHSSGGARLGRLLRRWQFAHKPIVHRSVGRPGASAGTHTHTHTHTRTDASPRADADASPRADAAWRIDGHRVGKRRGDR